MSKKAFQRVKKAKAPTLDQKPANKLEIPSEQVSDTTRQALEKAISEQMDSAVVEEAPSERAAEKPEDTIDPLFSSMLTPPSLKVASLAAKGRLNKSLPALQIDDLFISGEIRQKVQIVPQRMSVVYRTLTSADDLYVKRRLRDVKAEAPRYVEERYITMLLAAHLEEINGEPMPPMTDSHGDIKDELFDKRFARVCKVPYVLMERLWVNWRWFEERVSEALNGDFLGDG